MTKLKQAIQTTAKAEKLIEMMDNELRLYRAIIRRYHLMHGNQIFDGAFNFPISVEYSISRDADDNIICHEFDMANIGITGIYEKIVQMKKDLDEE